MYITHHTKGQIFKLGFEEVSEATFENGDFITIHLENETFECKSQDDFEGRITALERRVWLDKADKLTFHDVVKKDAINPSHYQSYIHIDNKTSLQWLEAMQYLPHFREPKSFLAAVELQVRKYLDRSGGKDNEIQETKKALWYLEFMLAYMINGNRPIRVADIKDILKKG